MRSARFIGLTALIGLSATVAFGKGHRMVYSPEQQAAALSTVLDASKDLDQVDQRLLVIYGDSPSSVRIQELKDEDAIVHKPDEKADAQLKAAGASLVKHLASLEPITGSCNITGEAAYDLTALARTSSELLQNRKAATAADIQAWTEIGGAQGTDRLAKMAELDCSVLKKTFASTAPLLQDAYTRIQQIAPEQPSRDLNAPVAKSSSPAPIAAPAAPAAAPAPVMAHPVHTAIPVPPPASVQPVAVKP